MLHPTVIQMKSNYGNHASLGCSIVILVIGQRVFMIYIEKWAPDVQKT